MARASRHWLTDLALVACLIGVALVCDAARCVSAACAQEEPGAPTKLYFGPAACTPCHAREQPLEDKELPPLCRCTEYTIWAKQDKHKEAYNVLTGERGQQIGRLLGQDVRAADAGCVACHGVALPPDKPELKHETFKIEDGVSCAVCHGPYEPWVDKHGSVLGRTAWRKLSREEKETRYGMADLWNPVKRANLCASCHIGDSAQGRVVTHAMYAAGHPPLPGIEVATFSDAMPRHWQYVGEKSPEVRALLGFDAAELERPKLVVLGATAELAASMRLLAGQAEASARAERPAERTLDFAQLDCYACHHDLKSPSWRQARGYSGEPGRPMPRRWPLVLVELAIRHAGQGEDDAGTARGEFAEKMARLERAFAARPFGDLAAVAAAARDIEGWVGELAERLGSMRYDQRAARALLHELCAIPGPSSSDFDSARQIAWAFCVVYDATEPKPPNDAQIRGILAELADELALELPSGRDRAILEALPRTLQAIAAHDPAWFCERISSLKELLPDPAAAAAGRE